MPLRHFIEHLYFKRFGQDQPENVMSIEQLVKDRNKKKENRKKQKGEKRNAEATPVEPLTEELEDPF